MTSKEKAKELVAKFYHAGILWIQSKQCALISVDEILYVIGEPTYFIETRVFYLRVKEEINNL